MARLEELLAARERVAGWYTERLEHHVLTPSAAGGDRHRRPGLGVPPDPRDEGLPRALGAPVCPRLVHRAARAPRPPPLSRGRRPPRLAGLRRPARPARRGASPAARRRD